MENYLVIPFLEKSKKLIFFLTIIIFEFITQVSNHYIFIADVFLKGCSIIFFQLENIKLGIFVSLIFSIN